MENQSFVKSDTSSSKNVTPDIQIVSSVQAKNGNLLPVLLTFSLCGLFFGLGGYYLGKHSSESTKGSSEDNLSVEYISSPTPAFTLFPTPNDKLESSWQSYANSNASYEIKYPPTWRVVPQGNGEGYGPKEIGEDVLWSINSYDKAIYNIDQVVDQFGKQFVDRKQTRQDITVSNIPATKFITTSTSNSDWYSETIVIETEKVIITISNGAISTEKLHKMKGVSPETTFEKFYNSFKLIE